MRLVIFGGSFNPPHTGHVSAARAVSKELKPDKLIVIPTFLPPHKALESGAPTPEQRLELCRLAFSGLPRLEVSDTEIARGGKSYTADTLRELRERYPDTELWLTVGTDMLRTLDSWYDAAYILRETKIAAVARDRGQMNLLRQKAGELRRTHRASVEIIEAKPFPAASTDIRRNLRNRGGLRLLGERVYAEIVRKRLYGVRVNLQWLRRRGYAMVRPNRVMHVRGCEEEAVRLAVQWGADPDKAAEAAILHDCTKKDPPEEQLRLCEKYGMIPDEVEINAGGRLLHAKTGAGVAAAEFGMDEDVVSAIRWHTTGKPDMTLLEKIIYMADYIEPTRNFPGVEKLRKLAYQDLDRALLLGLEMSRDEIVARGETPHVHTLTAIRWLQESLRA